MNITKYLQEVKSELKLVSWPEKQTAIRLTTVVIFASILTAAYIGLLDLGFTNLVNQLILKQ